MLVVLLSTSIIRADDSVPYRAAIPKAPAPPVIDGKLDEWSDAFCTPVEYFNADQKNRPGQFFYLWDDAAFYVGVRTLDEKPFAPDNPFWVGDAVEWYFDTRTAPIDGRLSWGTGAVHCFFTGLTHDQIGPRFSLRPGYLDAIPKLGVEVASQRTSHGLEIEFKLPWANFPDFHAKANATLHLDAELSYSDGVSRSFRTFAFGGPLSVEEPANLATVKLRDGFDDHDWSACGPVMMPMRVDISWKQTVAPVVKAAIAMPPNHLHDIGRITFQLTDLTGKQIAEYRAGEDEAIESQGGFICRSAVWPTSVADPGHYHVTAIVFDRADKELTRVAPRLNSVNMDQGY